MSQVFTVWLAGAALIGLVWLVRALCIGPMLRAREVLRSDSYDGPPASPPRISVIVAAKDEEENIEACVTSLLNQDYPLYEVVVVDDRSTDRTPMILQRLGQEAGSRLQVVTVKHLRPGWFGKNNAMREGVAVSTGDWLCFTDADCRQVSTRTLSMAMRHAQKHDADFLSVTPVLETKTVWEKITQPICAVVLIVWFLPERVNDPARKTAYANGAFMLMKRGCYDAIGGHERVRAEVNEDIHMARYAKQSGFKLRVVENDDLYRTRMYRTVGESWRGWSRIFYGCLQSPTRLGIAALLLFTLSIIPWASLTAALVGRAVAEADHVSQWNLAMGVWGCVVILLQFVTWHFVGVMGIRPTWSLTYPAGALVCLAMLASALLKALGIRGTTWRGTHYRGHRRIEPVAGGTVSSTGPSAGRVSAGGVVAEAASESSSRV